MENGSDSSSLVYLNVGGKKFCTSNDTLTRLEPDSLLATMFSGRHILSQDREGYTFIDRDGKYFGYILNWLRDGDVPILEDRKYPQLLKEAQYFQLQGLIDGISDILENKRKELDVLEEDKRKEKLGASDLTRSDIIKLFILNVDRPWLHLEGLNFSGLDLSSLKLSCIDFSNACMRNVCYSKANLSNVNFSHADDEGANFKEANLQECRFNFTNLQGASFVGVKIKNSSFVNAKNLSSNLGWVGVEYRVVNIGQTSLR